MKEKIIQKLTLRNILLLASDLFAIVGFIIYLVVATTGYYVGNAPHIGILLLSIFYIIGTVCFILFDEKIEKYETILFFVLAAMIILSFVFFVLDKEEVVGEMMIPVNHPQKQIEAAKATIVGVSFYFVSFLIFAVSSFFSRKKKEASTPIEA